MCLHGIQIEGLNRWNWDGDEIVQETIVPSSRAAVGSNREYDLDVRSYLATAHNAVLKRTLRHDVKEFLRDLEPTRFRRCWDLFQSGEPGAFDYRASVIPAFVAARIRY